MSVEPELREAIERLKSGDQDAFHIFYIHTYQFVYARAKFTIRDEHEAQDLMQEVYLAVYRNIGSLKNTDSVYSWLGGITLRQGMKLVNRKKRNILLSEDQEGMFEDLPDESRGTEERIARAEEIQIMKDCIYELSEEQRAVVLAYYYDEMKVEEIARLLEISEGTVKSRLYHARKRLKASLVELEKKQGYRLYSISIPAVLAAVGYLLGENTITAEAAGGIYSGICSCAGMKNMTENTASNTVGNIAGNTVGTAAGNAAGKAVRTAAGKAAGLTGKKLALIILGIAAGAALIGATIYIWYRALNAAKDAEQLRADENRQEEQSAEDVPEGTPEAEDGQTPGEDEEDPETYYREILDEYRQAEAEGYTGPASRYTYVIEELFDYDYESTWFTYNGEPLYYAIVDISNDGRPELFLSLKNSPSARGQIIDLYGYGESGPERIAFEPDDIWGWAYGGFDICKNGVLNRVERSGGASTVGNYYYRLPKNSTTAQYIDGIFHDGSFQCQRITDPDGGGYNITDEEYLSIQNDRYPVVTDTDPEIEWIRLGESENSTAEGGTDTSYDEAAVNDYYGDFLRFYKEQEAAGFPTTEAELINQIFMDRLYFKNGYAASGTELYYAAVDLAGDGVPEIFISDQRGTIYGAYGVLDHTEGQVIPLISDGSAYLGDRLRCEICENNLLKVTGSGGAASNMIAYYQAKPGGGSLECTEGILQNGEEYWFGYETEGRQEFVKEARAAESDYRDMEEKYQEKTGIQWHNCRNMRNRGKENRKTGTGKVCRNHSFTPALRRDAGREGTV